MGDKNFPVRRWMAALATLTICLAGCNRTSQPDQTTLSTQPNPTGSAATPIAPPQNTFADLVSRVAPAVVTVRRGSLGITIRPVTAGIAASLGLPDVRGALVDAVGNGSPAERAGLKPGDVITAFKGAPVTDTNSLRNAVARSQPGTEVTVTIIPGRQPQELRATLGESTR